METKENTQLPYNKPDYGSNTPYSDRQLHAQVSG